MSVAAEPVATALSLFRSFSHRATPTGLPKIFNVVRRTGLGSRTQSHAYIGISFPRIRGGFAAHFHTQFDCATPLPL